MKAERSPSLASVVVNNYNYGRFLRDAIDSALAQTYAPLEVIVVDDGSTDDSREIISSYGDRIIPDLKPNGGQASTFNAGFDKSRGEFVLFLDSDDMLLPTAVERAIEMLREPGVAKVHWPLWLIRGNKEAIEGTFPPTKMADGDVRERLIQDGPHADTGAPTSANLWSADFLERVLPMPEQDLRHHADSYLNTLAGVYGCVKLLPEPHGYYRVHSENAYASLARIDQLRRNMKMYHYRCALLSEHLARTGVTVDPAVWKKGNFHYEWLSHRITVAELVEALVPEGEAYIFVDDGVWGKSVLVPGRRRISMPDSDGASEDYPADDINAIDQFNAICEGDAPRLIVFVESALWWLEYYPRFAEYLRSKFALLHQSEVALIFQLRD